PPDSIEKHLIVCPQKTGHVFWHERKGVRYANTEGQALLVYYTRPCIETELQNRGVYSVVRTLREHRKLPLEQVVNTCGLSQCVNPLHWTGVPRLPKYRIDLLRGIVSVADDRPIVEPAVVRVRTFDGAVHVA